jgi:hypothetical protein
MEMSGQVHAPAALLQGKQPWYPLDRMLGEHQSRYGQGDENIFDPTETRIPTSRLSSPQPVAIPTALSRLLLIGVQFEFMMGFELKFGFLILNFVFLWHFSKGPYMPFLYSSAPLSHSLLLAKLVRPLKFWSMRKLRCFSPPANYTDLATAACQQS